ncbi:hypothetical protein AAULR_11190, partial [Lacticaseibacillus rhamnosus MTCC 5462]
VMRLFGWVFDGRSSKYATNACASRKESRSKVSKGHTLWRNGIRDSTGDKPMQKFLVKVQVLVKGRIRDGNCFWL